MKFIIRLEQLHIILNMLLFTIAFSATHFLRNVSKVRCTFSLLLLERGVASLG